MITVGVDYAAGEDSAAIVVCRADGCLELLGSGVIPPGDWRVGRGEIEAMIDAVVARFEPVDRSDALAVLRPVDWAGCIDGWRAQVAEGRRVGEGAVGGAPMSG